MVPKKMEGYLADLVDTPVHNYDFEAPQIPFIPMAVNRYIDARYLQSASITGGKITALTGVNTFDVHMVSVVQHWQYRSDTYGVTLRSTRRSIISTHRGIIPCSLGN